MYVLLLNNVQGVQIEKLQNQKATAFYFVIFQTLLRIYWYVGENLFVILVWIASTQQ